MKNIHMLKGYAYVILSGVIFGLMPLMSKFIYAEDVTPFTLVFLRSFLAVPFLAVIASRTKFGLRISVRALLPVGALAVVGYCLTPVLLFSSYQIIPSGMATVFHFIYPAVVVLGEFVFFKSNPGRRGFLSILACTVGIAMFYTPGTSPDPYGSAVALFSGVTYAAYILLLTKFRHREIPPFTLSLWVSLICSAVMLPVCIMTHQLVLPQSLAAWGLSVLFAVSLNVGAVVLFQQGTFIIGGAKASVLSTFEPVTGVVAGALVFNESISVAAAVGVVLVILASVLIALQSKE